MGPLEVEPIGLLTDALRLPSLSQDSDSARKKKKKKKIKAEVVSEEWTPAQARCPVGRRH